MRRYELMLVFRPDAPDDRIAAIIDRTTRQITAGGGQIIKVAPWGRRRLAYAIDRHREGAYHIVVFESPTEGIAELERGLLITEEILRQLVVRQDRPPARCATPTPSATATSRCFPPQRTRKKRMMVASGSTSRRARRLRPRSTERVERWR